MGRRRRVGGRRCGGGAAGWAQASSVHSDKTDRDAVDLHRSYPFYGQPHPAGVATEPQRNCVFMSFTLAPGASRQDLQTLLARWSAASAVLQQGNPVGTVQPTSAVAPATDTGEAFGLNPASLTVTIGLGPSVFGERFGLAAHKPALLAELPTLNGDNLDPGLVGGDLSIQACADDPQVCYHATRNLARIGRRIVTPSWAVLGFGRASAGPGQETPRNLLGFKDGTRNVSTEEQYSQFVWVANSDQPWMNGGTYQVVRKVRMCSNVGHRPDRRSAEDLRPAQGGGLTADRHEGIRHTRVRRQNSAGQPVIDPVSTSPSPHGRTTAG